MLHPSRLCRKILQTLEILRETSRDGCIASYTRPNRNSLFDVSVRAGEGNE